MAILRLGGGPRLPLCSSDPELKFLQRLPPGTNPAARVSVTMTGTFTPGTTFTLLRADAGRVNNSTFLFESIIYPPNQCYVPQIQYDMYSVYLYLSPTCVE